MQDTDVVIMGAGVAGLATAYQLTASGISVRLLEAHDRMGGRIYTIHDGAYPIELGAEFVHGRHPAALRTGLRAAQEIISVIK